MNTPNLSKTKTPMTAQTVEERITNYSEIALGYTHEEAMEEAARCLKCPARYCAVSCPVHNHIPEFIAKVREGDFEGAYQEITAVNPLPEVCGRICPQEKQCERNCTRGLKGQAVAIGRLERFSADWHRTNGNHAIAKSESTGKRVAIVGSGPSGLAAANWLSRAGHAVTVFERSDRIGGLMVYGIPNMKLGKDILQSKAEELSGQGVTFVTGVEVGKDKAAVDLLEEFDAVVLCCGASNPRDLNVPGRDAQGVYFAVDFLKENTKTLLNTEFKGESPISAKGKDVIVIGGGDTGNDCVATAIRQGCQSVIQLEMMPREPDEKIKNIPWTEFPTVCKTDYGQEEAILLYGQDPRRFQTTVKELMTDESGKLKAVKTVRLETTFDHLRMSMAEVPGSEELLDCQMLLIAAGFLGSQRYVADAFGVKLNDRTNVKTSEDGYQTNKEKVFTAGDMHRGQSVAARAIEEGCSAARAVDEYLAHAAD
ncbi:MAG: glutamate synthase small subunit [Oscillospiraceae bacterium]|nr:glutamate synthase small subunit [Oscillospiraceae bacterium]